MMTCLTGPTRQGYPGEDDPGRPGQRDIPPGNLEDDTHRYLDAEHLNNPTYSLTPYVSPHTYSLFLGYASLLRLTTHPA